MSRRADRGGAQPRRSRRRRRAGRRPRPAAARGRGRAGGTDRRSRIRAGRPVQLSVATVEQLDALPGHRPRDRAEDPRLPNRPRCIPLGRGARRGTRHRAGPRGTATGSGRPMSDRGCSRTYPLRPCRPRPCVGLAAANGVRWHGADAAAAAGAAFVGGAVAKEPRTRVALVALALLLAGWWWASARLDALDASVLVRTSARPRRRLPVVTGPHAAPASSCVSPRRYAASGRLPSTSRCSSSCLLGGRRPRAPIVELVARLRAAAGVARIRRADLASPARRPRRRARTGVADRGASRRPRRIRRPGAPLARRFGRPRAEGRAARGPRGDRARRGPGAVAGAPHELPRLRPVPPARGVGAERGVRRGRRARARLVAGRARAGSASSAPSPESARTCSPSVPQPSVIRAGIAGALGSLAWLAARPA